MIAIMNTVIQKANVIAESVIPAIAIPLPFGDLIPIIPKINPTIAGAIPSQQRKKEQIPNIMDAIAIPYFELPSAFWGVVG